MDDDNKFVERIASAIVVILLVLGTVIALAIIAALVVGGIALAGLVL